MNRFNIDKFMNIIFILYIVVYIAIFIEIYFFKNTFVAYIFMQIEIYLAVIELICGMYTQDKNSKYKMRMVVLLQCIKYPFLFII